jgi:hypothetical protein
VDRAGQVTHLELVLLSDVQDHRGLVGAAVAGSEVQGLLDLRRVDRLDSRAGFLYQLLA